MGDSLSYLDNLLELWSCKAPRTISVVWRYVNAVIYLLIYLFIYLFIYDDIWLGKKKTLKME